MPHRLLQWHEVGHLAALVYNLSFGASKPSPLRNPVAIRAWSAVHGSGPLEVVPSRGSTQEYAGDAGAPQALCASRPRRSRGDNEAAHGHRGSTGDPRFKQDLLNALAFPMPDVAAPDKSCHLRWEATVRCWWRGTSSPDAPSSCCASTSAHPAMAERTLVRGP